MIELLQPYISITLKLVTGMIGILAFLRITGKAQMAQITPLDTVSAFVIGALVGGVLYNPDMSMLHIIFALIVWTGFNMLVRFAMRSAYMRHLIKGKSDFLVKKGIINFGNFKRNSLEMEQFRMLLRQKGIFSMFDVEDVLFETNGAVTVLPTGKTADSFLIVNNGEFVESGLAGSQKSKEWALYHIKRNGFSSPSELFCMEWTPNKGIYFVSFEGKVKRGIIEVEAHEIEPDNTQV
ncbi:MAG: DUF421 domain-containing protein [Flavobacteriaceae bacterium]|nr:DUF421 domain-containing protein [Flavobacteriaceae bacterium]